MAGEKTEKATSKRKQDERKKGNIFQSKDVVVLGSLLATFTAFKVFASLIYDSLSKNMVSYLALAGTREQVNASDLKWFMVDTAIVFAKAAVPLLLVAGLAAIIFTIVQTRGLVTFEQMRPKFSKLNPISGIKKLFALKGLVELVKAFAKLAIIGYLFYSRFMDLLEEAPRLIDMEPAQALPMLGDFVFGLIYNVCAVFTFVALADYLYQRYSYEKQLRMSKQEIKEEYKNTEGDPQIKGKIRAKQREMAMQRMMQEVPKADVIIRNPTHFAVALAFDPEKNNAPVVLAKGVDLVALRIVKVAEEHDIMTIENKPLARGLYEAVELNREIPEQYYTAVAEVLAFVYNLKKKKVNV